MEAELPRPGEPAVVPGGFTLHTWEDADHDEVREVHNRAFAEASGGSATVTSRAFSPGDPLFCGFIVQPNGAWSVSPSGATTISASVGAQSIAGTCFGTVTGTYNNTTGELSFSNATIPGDPQECVINGSLYASPVITIVP